MPFEKGKSGNPNGRPKKGDSFAELWAKHSTYGKDDSAKFFDVIDTRIESGDPRIIVEVMNRLYGKPKESIEIDTGENINSFAEWVKSVVESKEA